MIDLPERANLRDLGGYPTRHGTTLARGLLFRGGELCTVDPALAAHLAEEVGIRRVVDLRMEDEARCGNTTLPGACERLHLPLFVDVPAHWANPIDRTPPSTARRYFEMAQVGRETLRQVVELLAEEPAQPTLIHCVAGRDRTGIVIATVLDLLDVPDDVIARDYALSGVMDDAEGRTAHPDNILLLLDLIRAEHGSVREMLLDAGATENTLDRLRAALVVP
jgi:protein-tyrosine phosphatase